MNTSTLLLLLLSIVLAGGLSYFQYYSKIKNKSKLSLFLALLRFAVYFGVLLLLINPKITRQSYEVQKTPLALVIDNSASIKYLKADATAQEVYKKISANKALQDKFEIQSYRFDADFQTESTFDFKGTQSNIEAVSKNLKSIHKNKRFPIVLMTDGNQTIGSDYVYGFPNKTTVYPIVLGDTTAFMDLKINQINANKYAFHKNKFPVEVFLSYSGLQNVEANFNIKQGNSTVLQQSVSFGPNKKTAIVNVLLPANSVGLQIYEASVSSKAQEKNTYNNTKKFAVEIIDQKSEVAIISAISHPDISALKRSIEQNSQRSVTLLKPNATDLTKYNVLILYQPNTTFKAVFDTNKNLQLPTWIITGTQTDYNFLNQQQKDLAFKMSNQSEEFTATFDTNFNLFATDNIGFESFPPLNNLFGNVEVNGATTTLLGSKVRAIDAAAPLLSFNNQSPRTAYLMGENIWKWRMQTNIKKESFESFDIFIDKIIQYLATTNSRKSLVVAHESFYNAGDALLISAQYFNKNYEFDEKARLTIALKNTETNKTKNYDLLKSTNSFSADLEGLAAGKYSFVVKELNSNTTYSSRFELLDFDIEKQFINPNVPQLTQLATQTQGAVFMPNQIEALIESLKNNTDFTAVEKQITTKKPLIDSVLLLILIALFLATEWFVRKYNGML
jgi:competence protein ComGC